MSSVEPVKVLEWSLVEPEPMMVSRFRPGPPTSAATLFVADHELETIETKEALAELLTDRFRGILSVVEQHWMRVRESADKKVASLAGGR